MQKILEKVTIILVAIFLLVLSQLPMYYVNYENNKNNIYGVANKISVNFIIIALLVVIIAIFLGKKRGFYKQIAKTLELRNIVLIFVLAILCVILNIIINLFIRVHHLGTMYNQDVIDNILGSLLWFSKIFGVAILAPILEESIFRASIYQLFENTKISFAVSSLLFAFVHSGYSWVFLSYLPVSLGITFIYHRRKILTDSILIHSIFNLLVIYLNFILINIR
ncbi:CPBP family intramembrane metalloprotease [Lactococcus lactis]|jgi:uncharacterized protein|uniref:CPBP family intramembrane glutamic endopeptidase n=1 Tax=Lactococcus lactis TaxID=1358 RepID=UPI001F53BA90|nr:type II CAAX endopeptidase family protein [Lactococcus lactis]MCI1072530.1 CPBP family intramembrane metalloprotease [Lactococcus lactis]MCT1182972.1 CPBP family intramembrane metalloprotease [Lactococcus lactis]